MLISQVCQKKCTGDVPKICLFYDCSYKNIFDTVIKFTFDRILYNCKSLFVV